MRRTISAVVGLATLLVASFAQAETQGDEKIVIDAAAPAHTFPHFCEQMFGSGRAVLALRDRFRHDLREVKQITGCSYVRFHAVVQYVFSSYDVNDHVPQLYNSFT